MEQARLTTGPVIRLLPERNAREGFLEPATFEHVTGWRKGEVQTLAWSDVDRAHRRITLRRAHSKTAEPRVLTLVGELGALIDRRWAGLRVPHRGPRHGALSPVRLPPGRAAHRRLPQGLGHGLRRPPAWRGRSSMTSAGRRCGTSRRPACSQSVAMKISGHKTASVYRRYRIVDEHGHRGRAGPDPGGTLPADAPRDRDAPPTRCPRSEG